MWAVFNGILGSSLRPARRSWRYLPSHFLTVFGVVSKTLAVGFTPQAMACLTIRSRRLGDGLGQSSDAEIRNGTIDLPWR
jgi:hypothetical protein